MLFTDTTRFLWRPTGVTDAELLYEWPYVFQNMLTRPIGLKATEGYLRQMQRDLLLTPRLMPIADRMLHHIAAHRAAPFLQARIRRIVRRFNYKHEKMVAVLGATHTRLGEKSLLGEMLDVDLLQIVFQQL
jgi:hypothetical protein